MCSCLVLMCVCHLKREAIADLEAAAAAVGEAIEIRPRYYIRVRRPTLKEYLDIRDIRMQLMPVELEEEAFEALFALGWGGRVSGRGEARGEKKTGKRRTCTI